MKTETEVTIEVGELRAEECLSNEPEGFTIKIFMACSKTATKVFRLTGLNTPISQVLKIANVAGKELEFWLCNKKNKIIANAILPLPHTQNQPESATVELKMTSTVLARLAVRLSVSRREIEKIVYVQPDEQLLKKVEDPNEIQRREQEEQNRQKELEQQQAALKQVKKAAITISKYNKKDIPFI